MILQWPSAPHSIKRGTLKPGLSKESRQARKASLTAASFLLEWQFSNLPKFPGLIFRRQTTEYQKQDPHRLAKSPVSLSAPCEAHGSLAARRKPCHHSFINYVARRSACDCFRIRNRHAKALFESHNQFHAVEAHCRNVKPETLNSSPLHRHCNPHAAADTEARDAFGIAFILHQMNQSREHPRPARADGMTERYGSATLIQLCPIQC